MKTVGLQIEMEVPAAVLRQSREAILTMSVSEVFKMKVADLKQCLRNLSLPVSGNKAALQLRFVQHLSREQEASTSRTEEGNGHHEDEVSIQHDHLLSKLRKLSIKAWVMKPLIKPPGMRDGSLNEDEVLCSIPSFTKAHRTVNHSARDPQQSCIQVEYIRAVGLVCNDTFPMLATSVDSMACVTNEEGVREAIAIEFKTMTTPETIEMALSIADKHGRFVIISDIGGNTESASSFRSIVKTTAHRTQCIHQAAVLGVKRVMFVVAKGGRSGKGEILFIALLGFTKPIIEAHVSLLYIISLFAFSWIGNEADTIPDAYGEMLQEEHSSELHSFKSYYALSRALEKRVVEHNTPLPPSRMICPKGIVFWNALKGDVDVFSRNMLNFARVNVAENPIISIIARMLRTQVANAAIVHRFLEAREKGSLPSFRPGTKYNYFKVRKAVTRISSARSFVRRMAEDWIRKENTSFNVNGNRDDSSDSDSQRKGKRNIIESFNKGSQKMKRLNHRLHRGKSSGEEEILCALQRCSYLDQNLFAKRKEDDD